MIDIETFRDYFSKNKVIISEHADMRFKQRNIKIKDIRYAINNGKIIEKYPEDTPYPSCLILGKTMDGRYMHIVLSDEGDLSRVITAYFPDSEKWSEDFENRLEK